MLSSLRRQLTTLDLDEIFSYQTTKEVRMLDRRLGLLCWLIRVIVAAYVIGYVFIYCEGYTATEKGVGHVISQISGATYSTYSGSPRTWDAVDAVQPALENGAAFVSTQVYLTPGQTSGTCPSPSKQCTDNSDCTGRSDYNEHISTGQCTNSMCSENQWCPAFSDASVSTTQNHQLQGADTLSLWVKASIAFPSLDASRIFSTIDEEKPGAYSGGTGAGITNVVTGPSSTTIGDGSSMPPDQFTVGELLELAGTSYDTVKSTGCVLAVSTLWDCFVDNTQPCYPTINVQRLDLSTRRNGFSYEYAHYYRTTSATSTLTRDLYTVKGVRLLLSSRGVGKKVSLSAIMLQISSGIALLWLANFAADFLMLHVLPERKHYRTYKQERTPDFSDLRNKIAEVEGEKKKLRERKNRFANKYFES